MQIIKLLRLDKYHSVYLRRNGQHRSVLPICRIKGSVRHAIPTIVNKRIEDLLRVYNHQCDLFVLVAIKGDSIGCAAWPQNAGFDFNVISAEQADVG